MEDITRRLHGWRQEYEEVNSCCRHYSQLRFIMVSVFFVVVAGILALIVKSPEMTIQHSSIPAAVACVLGVLITVIFLQYELRLERLIRYYQEYAIELEQRLDYQLWTRRPQSNRTFNATKVLYAVFILFWMALVVTSLFLTSSK